MEFSAKQIAAFIQGEIIGDENATVHTFAKIEEGIPGAISSTSTCHCCTSFFSSIAHQHNSSFSNQRRTRHCVYNIVLFSSINNTSNNRIINIFKGS